jgi:hypothetical protein
MESITQAFLMQLLVQTPVLMVYLAGLTLALVFWRRCMVPSLLSLIACVIMLLVTVTHVYLNQYFVLARIERGWTTEKVGWMFTAAGLSSVTLHAISLVLLLIAVFIGRKHPQSVKN